MSQRSPPILEFVKILSEITQNVNFGVYAREKYPARIIHCNEAFARIHGYQTVEEVLNLISWDFIEPGDAKLANLELEKTGSFIGDIKAHTKDGRAIIINLTVVEIRNEIVIGFVHDVTEERKIKEDLRESEAKYRALVDTIREGLIIVDESKNIVFVNPGFCKILNYEKNELIGVNLSQLFSPEQFKSIINETQNRKQGKLDPYTIELIAKQNLKKLVLMSVAPLYDSASKYVGAIAVCVDISSAKTQSRDESQKPDIFLKILCNEVSEQVLLAKGWLDILHTEVKIPEYVDRIEKAQRSIQKVEDLSKQVISLLNPNITLNKTSLLEFSMHLKNHLIPLLSPKGCNLTVKLTIEKADEYKCPAILEYAIEQVARSSLKRMSHNIEISYSLTSLNQVLIEIRDDGVTPFIDELSPDHFQGNYLASILVKKIGGTYMSKPHITGKGMHVLINLP